VSRLTAVADQAKWRVRGRDHSLTSLAAAPVSRAQP
jgi:hypothetical protein